MKKKLVAAILLSISAFTRISAEETLEITADSAVQAALDTNASVKKGAITLNQAKREYKHAWNNFLPEVSASATGTAQDNSLSTTGQTRSISGGMSASLSLSASLIQKIRLLKESYQSGQADYEDTVRDVETTVRKAFYSILYQQQSVESYKANVKSYEKQYEQTKTRKERGLVPEIDLLTAEVNLKSARLDLKNAEKSYYNSVIEFLNEIGLETNPAETRITFKGSLDDAESVAGMKEKTPTKEKIDELVENSPSVRSAQTELAAAKLNKTYTATSSYLPSLNLSANVNPFEKTYYKDSGETVDSDSWSASVGISIPLDGLVPGSAKMDSVLEKDDTIKTLELELADTKKSVRTQIIEKIHDIEISNETIEERKLNMELAKKTYEMEEEAYGKGTKDLLTVQNALDSYRSAQVEWRKEQYNLISYVLDLENIAGLESGSLLKK
ncbi:MAG: TolC family protein [Treponema sp.]|nr:TolC family protein [Treponema sp.]